MPIPSWARARYWKLIEGGYVLQAALFKMYANSVFSAVKDDTFLVNEGLFETASKPSFNPSTQRIQKTTPFLEDGKVQEWEVVSLGGSDLAALKAQAYTAKLHKILRLREIKEEAGITVTAKPVDTSFKAMQRLDILQRGFAQAPLYTSVDFIYKDGSTAARNAAQLLTIYRAALEHIADCSVTCKTHIDALNVLNDNSAKTAADLAAYDESGSWPTTL